MTGAAAIHPYRVDIPQAALDDWPDGCAGRYGQTSCLAPPAATA
jgi:hypothetical protein